MTTSHSGTIAQLLYAQKHQLNFAQIVGDLHALLMLFAGPHLIFEWDCDDIALFDLSSTRIALGWDTNPGKGYSACLTVSVGSATEPTSPPFNNGHEEMCSRLVERLHKEFPALTILWHQTNEHLTADLIDRLVEEPSRNLSGWEIHWRGNCRAVPQRCGRPRHSPNERWATATIAVPAWIRFERRAKPYTIYRQSGPRPAPRRCQNGAQHFKADGCDRLLRPIVWTTHGRAGSNGF